MIASAMLEQNGSVELKISRLPLSHASGKERAELLVILEACGFNGKWTASFLNNRRSDTRGMPGLKAGADGQLILGVRSHPKEPGHYSEFQLIPPPNQNIDEARTLLEKYCEANDDRKQFHKKKEKAKDKDTDKVNAGAQMPVAEVLAIAAPTEVKPVKIDLPDFEAIKVSDLPRMAALEKKLTEQRQLLEVGRQERHQLAADIEHAKSKIVALEKDEVELLKGLPPEDHWPEIITRIQECRESFRQFLNQS